MATFLKRPLFESHLTKKESKDNEERAVKSRFFIFVSPSPPLFLFFFNQE